MSTFQKQIYDMLLESQYWPPERMLEFQRGQLSQLLKHARTNVPFYNERLDPIFRSNGNIDWDRWHEIPIVKRHHLVEQRDNMLATRLPPGHGKTRDIFSSGSSGTPIITTHSSFAGWVSAQAVYRAQRWNNLDWSKTWLNTIGPNSWNALWPEGEERESWAPMWMENDLRGKCYMLSPSTPEEQIIEFILRNKVNFFAGRPTFLQSIALASERLNIPVKLDAIITFGTGIAEDEREDLLRVFGAKIISYYSSGEGYKMGISCDNGHHYHINSEIIHLEILDDDDNPCQIGQPGRVVITPIFSTAQPLIRYEQGDIAIRGPNCSCGKTLPVLQEISGRVEHLFTLPDGRRIVPILPQQDFIANFGSKTWQLVQTGLSTVELRYVRTNPAGDINKTYAKEVIRKRIHKDLQVKFVRLEKTPLTAAGKLIQYKSELPKSHK